MRRASEATTAIIEPVVAGLGYELVGAELGQAENGHTLRVYIDKAGGVDIDDCATVSHQLDAVLDVEDPIGEPYQLEVSSPGIDRPLFTEAQFAVQRGEEVRVRLLVGVDGRRNYKGRLTGVADGVLSVEVDGVEHALPLADVERAHLVGRLP